MAVSMARASRAASGGSRSAKPAGKRPRWSLSLAVMSEVLMPHIPLPRQRERCYGFAAMSETDRPAISLAISPAISIVAPCFNEEGVLPEFLRRAGTVLEGLESAGSGPSEIVLVDDGSRDDTWALMQAAAAQDRRIVAVRLMRNHGHQLALTAGLSICRGA